MTHSRALLLAGIAGFCVRIQAHVGLPDWNERGGGSGCICAVLTAVADGWALVQVGRLALTRAKRKTPASRVTPLDGYGRQSHHSAPLSSGSQACMFQRALLFLCER